MTATELINIVQGDKNDLKKWFDNFDGQSNSINDWQNLLGYPLETHSCNICHRIRNKILSGISHYFGVKHLGNTKYESLGQEYLNEAVELIKKGEEIRPLLKEVYPKIYAFLY